MSVGKRIKRLRALIPEEVTLVAVSKFHPAEVVQEAYDAGQRVFGESRAQELKAKQPLLPADIEWHFIGTLQRNKVKDIISYVHTIQSVDSLKLLKEIERQASIHDRIIRILFEIYVAKEETKHGFTPEECKEMLRGLDRSAFPHIRVAGLMCMATYTEDEEQIKSEFRQVRTLFEEVKQEFFRYDDNFKELSMGMSHDFPVAIHEGSTMVRIGTSIFGDREY